MQLLVISPGITDRSNLLAFIFCCFVGKDVVLFLPLLLLSSQMSKARKAEEEGGQQRNFLSVFYFLFIRALMLP